uniref:Uncharacterized protein n=1 Tax=Siphoviridae sp. ctKwY15 TaxID=2827843 RepID=A0A8S5SU41_9CAUD|nr:MAG TPA: hypothetical protein [Siphoviridae sp. ctKwY15]
MADNSNSLEQIKELNTQYKILRKGGIVTEVSLKTNVADFPVRNPSVIAKVLDLLINESQKQIESEVEK